MPYQPEYDEGAMKRIVMELASRLGRIPTEEEVHDFIFGDDETRQQIWDKGAGQTDGA